MPKLSLEEFKRRCIKIHGTKYTYDDVVYVNNRTPVQLFCTVHNGTFTSSPESLFKGHGCSTCAGCKTSNTEEFIKKCELKHPLKFGYDKVIYKNAHTLVSLLCKAHGGYFETTPNKLLSGAGCNVCHKNKKMTHETYLSKVKKIHGDSYNYESLVFTGTTKTVKLFCNGHNGYIDVYANTLLKTPKHSCGICSGKSQRTTEQFVSVAQKVHNEKYYYDETVYVGSEQKVIIGCTEHGNFTTTPKAHLTGRGCPKCGKYGFQPNEPGYLYVQKLSRNDEVLYKVGITGDLDRRMTEQSRTSVYHHEYLFSQKFDTGLDALVVENKIKGTVQCGVVSASELPSGFTETFASTDFEAVMEIVMQYKK